MLTIKYAYARIRSGFARFKMASLLVRARRKFDREALPDEHYWLEWIIAYYHIGYIEWYERPEVTLGIIRNLKKEYERRKKFSDAISNSSPR